MISTRGLGVISPRSLQLLVMSNTSGTVCSLTNVGSAAVSLGTNAAPLNLHQVVPLWFQFIPSTLGNQFVHFLPYSQRFVFHLLAVGLHVFRSGLDHTSPGLIINFLRPHLHLLEIFAKVFVNDCRLVDVHICREGGLPAVH